MRLVDVVTFLACLVAMACALSGCTGPTSRPPAPLRLRFVLDPGFAGELRVEEDPGLALDYSRVYDLRPKGGAVLLPKGFLGANGPNVPYVVTEVVDTTGKVISRGEHPPPGVVGVRGLVGKSSGRGTDWYFQIWDGKTPPGFPPNWKKP